MAPGGEVGHHVDDPADRLPSRRKARLAPQPRTIGVSL
jgi:hypothetical protein